MIAQKWKRVKYSPLHASRPLHPRLNTTWVTLWTGQSPTTPKFILSPKSPIHLIRVAPERDECLLATVSALRDHRHVALLIDGQHYTQDQNKFPCIMEVIKHVRVVFPKGSLPIILLHQGHMRNVLNLVTSLARQSIRVIHRWENVPGALLHQLVRVSTAGYLFLSPFPTHFPFSQGIMTICCYTSTAALRKDH